MFDLKQKERVKEFLFYRNAWYAAHHSSWYKSRPLEMRAIKRKYRKIIRRARSIVGPGLGDYDTISIAYGLSKYRNVCRSFEHWKSKHVPGRFERP